MENNEMIDSISNVDDVVDEKKESKVKKPAAKKTTAKKTADKKSVEKKSTGKKAAAKEPNIKKKMFIEFEGQQIDEEFIVKKVVEDCKKQEVTVKELTLYFKPEDNACYYVVNDDVSGKVELF